MLYFALHSLIMVCKCVCISVCVSVEVPLWSFCLYCEQSFSILGYSESSYRPALLMRPLGMDTEVCVSTQKAFKVSQVCVKKREERREKEIIWIKSSPKLYNYHHPHVHCWIYSMYTNICACIYPPSFPIDNTHLLLKPLAMQANSCSPHYTIQKNEKSCIVRSLSLLGQMCCFCLSQS